jgi:peptidyl-prolyl cis-trans isomerase B (cyclophilin B)
MTYPPQPGQSGGFPPPPDQYGQQPYYPGYGGQAPPPKGKTGLWIGLGVAVGMVVALGITGFVAPGFFLDKDNTTAASTPTSTTAAPPPTSAPDSTTTPAPARRESMPQRPTPLENPISCQYPADQRSKAAKPVNGPPAGQVPSNGTVTATVKTTAGDLQLTLDRTLAPCTVHNFVSLANQNYYTGTSCHRLGTEGLRMLQCGDPLGTGTGGPGYTFKDETFPQLTYGRGVLAMANAGPDTNGSQFFMVYGDAPLPPYYTVFGSISDEGLRVLDKVASAGVDPVSAQQTGDGTGKPRTPVQFTAITVG